MPKASNTNLAERSAETRERILATALREFSDHGLAGARTETIASKAGVNKALLYYYFESKEKLYEAALDMSAGKVRDASMAVFLSYSTPGERIVKTALNHFDRILEQREFQSLLQQEMMRVHKGESGGALPMLVKQTFAPLHAMFQQQVREGIASGELIDADWMQIILAAQGANIFFFMSAPVWRLLNPEDPYTVEALKARRKAMVEFLGRALFQDRKHGAEVAARVYADTPMPEIEGDRIKFGRLDERTK